MIMKNTTANPGIIYLATNPAMPGFTKFGQTHGTTKRDLIDRFNQMYRTNVPAPFVYKFAAVVSNPAYVEDLIKRSFRRFRPRQDREFLKGAPVDQIIKTIELYVLHELTLAYEDHAGIASPNGERQARGENVYRDHPLFDGVDTEAGVRWRYDHSMVFLFISQKKVRFAGQDWSLSALSKHLGKDVNYKFHFEVRNRANGQWERLNVREKRLLQEQKPTR